MNDEIKQIDLELTVDNYYENGDHITTERKVTADSPPFRYVSGPSMILDKAREALDEWEQDFIFPATGADNPEGGDASYFVEVTASSDTALIPVGTKFEFC